MRMNQQDKPLIVRVSSMIDKVSQLQRLFRISFACKWEFHTLIIERGHTSPILFEWRNSTRSLRPDGRLARWRLTLLTARPCIPGRDHETDGGTGSTSSTAWFATVGSPSHSKYLSTPSPQRSSSRYSQPPPR